jgi:hypothetical protein
LSYFFILLSTSTYCLPRRKPIADAAFCDVIRPILVN